MPSQPIATWITPCNSRRVSVEGTRTRRQTIGLIPCSQTLICTIDSGSDEADAAEHSFGSVDFSLRFIHQDYPISLIPHRSVCSPTWPKRTASRSRGHLSGLHPGPP